MSQVTVTAKTGPNQAITAGVLTGVNGINFDLKEMVLSVSREGQPNPLQFDLSTVTTVTFTISGTTYTVVVS